MFRLITLGACFLERDGVRIEAASAHRKGLALLALLAASGERGVSRDTAMALLWPDSDEARARTSLRQLIHSLRTQLQAPDLLLASPELRLDPGTITSDVAAFRTALEAGDAVTAMSHYDGPFLDGFHLRGGEELERWVATERAALAQAAARALEQLAVAAGEAGDLAGATGWWRRLAEADPLSTRAALGLMRALDASGERAAALQHARVHELMVAEELGGAPDPSVTALAAELRSAPTERPQPVVPVVPAAPVAARAAASQHATPPHAVATLAADRRALPPTRRRVRFVLPLAAVLIVAAGIVAAGILLAGGRHAVPPMDASVAVLPLVNISGNTDDDAFSDGLTDNLITALAGVPGIRVIARTSAFAFRNSGADLRIIADSLGVATVLEGGVQRVGDRIKVNVQLVRAADLSVLWAASHDRELSDMFAVQDEITTAIVAALSGRLAAQPDATSRRTPDVRAYELYLRGRHIFTMRTDREAIALAEGYFTEALEHDPLLAEAHAGLSDVHTRRAVFGFAPARRSFARAEAAALRALELDSTIAAAHTALGHTWCVADFDWQRAEVAFRRALELEPGYTFGRLPFAVCLVIQARFEEAERQLDIARYHDPLAPAISNVAGRLDVARGRPDQAIAHLRQALELSPQMDLAWQQLGHAYLQKGMAAEAVAALERAAAMSGARDSLHLAYALAVTGRPDLAAQILDAALATPDSDALAFHIALAYSGLGNDDQVFAWLERGLAEASSFIGSFVVEPGFQRLHQDPRWLALVSRQRGMQRL
ncbi:MAG TPA: BTAD domain-containing putative transcriptional regulator [Longimicrobiales bacterium]|nr:BTAD domain-containing putative transcriptional regulator [Longimicrobiales bacterium]